MMPLLLLLLAASAALCTGELLGLRFRRLAYERRHESFRTFQTHFRRANVHVDVLLAVQDLMQKITTVRGFPARPSDDLLAVYGLHVEDVQDAVAVVAGMAHCLSPAVLEPEAWQRVATVEDLVYAVHRLHHEARRANTDRRRTASAI